jgi:hypothetical protein
MAEAAVRDHQTAVSITEITMTFVDLCVDRGRLDVAEAPSWLPIARLKIALRPEGMAV